jgi:hypothetical protein
MQLAHAKFRDIVLRGLPTSSLRSGVLVTIPFVSALAVFLAARRVAGAMDSQLAPVPLFLTGVFLLGWVLSVGVTFRGGIQQVPGPPANGTRATSNYFLGAAWISILLFAFACSFPFNRFFDWLVWAPTIAIGVFLPHYLRRQAHVLPKCDHNRRPQISIASEPSEQVLQTITRIRADDGSESIRASLWVEFAPTDRNATIYVAFCPPFRRLPEVDVDFDDAIVSAVKLTQVLHNGAQVDVTLTHPAPTDTAVAIELFAAETPPDGALRYP